MQASPLFLTASALADTPVVPSVRVKPKGELPNSVRNPSAAMGKAETRTRGRGGGGGGGGDGGGGGNPGYELPAPSPLPSLRDLGLAV